MTTAIVFNSGFVQVTSNGPMSFQLAGRDILVTNIAQPGDSGSNCPATHGPYQPGTQSLNAIFAGELGIGAGFGRYTGTAYPKLWYAGSIEFTGNYTIPTGFPAPGVIAQPCTLGGTLKAYLNNPFIGNPGPAVFDATLSGNAVAVLEFTPLGSAYSCAKVTYNLL